MSLAMGLLLSVSAGLGCQSSSGTKVPHDGGTDSGLDSDSDTDTSEYTDSGEEDTELNTASETESPCDRAGEPCTEGQRCEENDSGPECVDNGCDDLDCGEGYDCRPAETGTGHVCQEAACAEHVECPPEEYCDGTTCRVDECEEMTRRCEGDTVLECDAAGSGEVSIFTCENGIYHLSECLDDGAGQAACSCEDDWDCPPHTVCEVGVCSGTGQEPSCTLPPVDFTDVLPGLELHWGGDSRAAEDTAHDGTAEANSAPWSTYKHVLNTPTVANLDDDNGDGLINELDFPEIIFTALKGNTPWTDGVVRAIHGGGPNKGADYFSRCGALLWTESAPIDDACVGPTANSGAPVAVGDLNYDGLPEIVVPLESKKFQILDNKGGLIYTLPLAWNPSTVGDTISVVNLDHTGYAELVLGPHVFVLGDDPDDGSLIVTHMLTGTKSIGTNGAASMACPADLAPDRDGDEIAVGTTLYGLPEELPTCDTPPCTGALDVVWHAPDVGEQSADLNGTSKTNEGFCAVADIWGEDFGTAPGPLNPPDGNPEVILIANGHLVVLDGATGTLIDIRSLGGGDRGGAPNVDDFDGDGYMEVASALRTHYVVLDLQEPESTYCPSWDQVLPQSSDDGNNPNLPASERTPGGSCTKGADCNPGAVCGAAGQCVCLHNGWKRGSDDASSRITASSVFDFNGDGSAEVIYNDECELRVYRGLDGQVLYHQVSRSRTGIENPVVADVDNDGNAEIVAVSNNAVGDRCNTQPDGIEGVNGLRVFGDPTDTWVSARRIWNQQSYHVTNVTESGGIPPHEAESWRLFSGRSYNTYRSQPRSYGVAPDLTVAGVSVSASGGGCDLTAATQANIAFEVRNQGDLRVGPGVVVSVFGIWDAEAVDEPLLDGSGNPLVATLTSSLEPGASTILTLPYDAANNAAGRLPDKIRVVVDANDAERECLEDNNSAVSEVVANSEWADLRLSISDISGCPDVTITAILHNDGEVAAVNVTVRFFAGDPSQGGTPLGDTLVAGPIPPKDSIEFEAVIKDFPTWGEIIVYGVADPEQEIEDCARGNNTASASPHSCGGIVF